jgi:hypothetical protein
MAKAGTTAVMTESTFEVTITPRVNDGYIYQLKHSQYIEHLDVQLEIGYNDSSLEINVQRGSGTSEYTLLVEQKDKLVHSFTTKSVNHCSAIDFDSEYYDTEGIDSDDYVTVIFDFQPKVYMPNLIPDFVSV